MVMDPRFRDLSAIMDDYVLDYNGGFKQEDFFPLLDQTAVTHPFDPPDVKPNCNCDSGSCLGVNPDGNSPEDCEIFSDIALQYISQMLLEENLEESGSFYQESSALHEAEKPFYEILGEKYPPSPNQHPLYLVDNNPESPDEYASGCYNNYNSIGSSDRCSKCGLGGCLSSQSAFLALNDSNSQSSSSNSSNGHSNVIDLDGLVESPTNSVGVSDLYNESNPLLQFQRGVEEASKFLPNGNSLVIDVDNNWFSTRQVPKEESLDLKVKVEKKDEGSHLGNESRGRKNPHPNDFDSEEGRSNKQTAVFSSGTVRSEVFDRVLLCGGDRCRALSDLQETLQNGVSKNRGSSKGANGGGKSRGKKQSGKREVIDLRSLLIQCAQAIAADDRRTGSELLKQIRQHSSPFGDGSQRLAHMFADGLQARMSGTGSEIYMSLTNRRTASDILKAYQLYLAACPFKKISYFFTNQTILDKVNNATRIHIVDFGISYGFQWPCLLQRLGGRPGGPPKVRITGIDVPQPGFRPADRIEETGRRLADYAREFNIHFGFTAIACSKWETIQVDDIKIESDEVLIVNSMFQFSKLPDETVAVDSPRDIVLKTIRKMNPDVFIHGAINGAYSAPFFITRFREALFHWSAMFDMLESNVPREQPERLLLEREIFSREAVNVIACEGVERIERPETYKQWQFRTLRAGFMQLPLNKDIMKKSRDKVRSSYHKDFVIDEDIQWMLQGWKGRIIYALSTWRPDNSSL